MGFITITILLGIGKKTVDLNSGFEHGMEYLEIFGIQLSVFKVMNSMKFRVAVWKSMDFRRFCGGILGGAKLLYASIFFMQFDEKFI